MLLGKCQSCTYLWSLWSTLRQSQDPEAHAGISLSSWAQAVDLLAGNPKRRWERPQTAASAWCCTCAVTASPDGRDRGYQVRVSWRTCLQQISTLLRALQSRGETHGSIPGDQLGKSQGAPRDKSCSLATKPHSSVHAGTLVWLACRNTGLFCSPRMG